MEKWPKEKIEIIEHCPFCSSKSVMDEVYERQDDNMSFTDIWSYIKCACCKSIYLRNRPIQETIYLAYQNYYTHKSYNHLEQNSLITKLINGYLNRKFNLNYDFSHGLGFYLFSLNPIWAMKLDNLLRNIPKGTKSILDVGCGNGDFLLNFKGTNYEAYGCEPDFKAVEFCQKRGLNVYLGDISCNEINGKKFDFITLSHVIEHVYDLDYLIDKVKKLLSPNGKVWVAYPNTNALGLKFFQQGWSGLHPPCHIMIPSQDIFKQILVKHGFKNIHFLSKGTNSKVQWLQSNKMAKREKVNEFFANKYLYIYSNMKGLFNKETMEEVILVAEI